MENILKAKKVIKKNFINHINKLNINKIYGIIISLSNFKQLYVPTISPIPPNDTMLRRLLSIKANDIFLVLVILFLKKSI